MKKLALAASLAAFGATGASALTLNIGDGAVGCESGYASINGISCGSTIGDIGNGFGGDAINFAGEGLLLGYVADASGSSNNYGDGAMVTLAEAGELVFSIFGGSQSFDGTVSIGETLTSLSTFVFQYQATTANPVNTSQSLGTFAAGTYFFKFDATAPVNNPSRDDSFYSLEVTAVPLPASALLLLAGAGALAGMGRKKKS